MPALMHKYFVKGDDMSVEEIIESISSKMTEYIKDDPNCQIEFEMTDDKPVEGYFPNGIYEFRLSGIDIDKFGVIGLKFYPNVIKKFGSLIGDYFPTDKYDFISGGVVGMIDLNTKMMFRKYQQYKFMTSFGIDRQFVARKELNDDAIDYAFGKENNLQIECLKVIFDQVSEGLFSNL